MDPIAPERWRLVVEYDGRAFCGWQLQPGQRSVQGVIESALERLFGHPIRVSVSGRTDAGVHALGQVISFTSPQPRAPATVVKAMNATLPNDVAVVSAEPVPAAFDPRRWAWAKHYRYTWLERPARSPLRHDRVWPVREPLDLAAMRAAAAQLVGTHDFTSFRAEGCTANGPVRTVEAADLRRVNDELWLEVMGQGFLRHMVRIIAGTLYDVGRGKRSPADFGAVLAAADRAKAGQTAPPGGLCLVRVDYQDEPPPWMRGSPPGAPGAFDDPDVHDDPDE